MFLPSLGARVLRDPEPEDAHLESSKTIREIRSICLVTYLSRAPHVPVITDEGASLSLDRRLFGGLNAISFDNIVVCPPNLCRPRARRVLIILRALLRSLVPQGTKSAWIRAM